jgi:dienelactone hydrolase
MSDVGHWVKACVLLSTLATAVCAHARASSADELVKFDGAPYILGQLQQRRAISSSEMTMPTAIQGYLSKPDGEGPFPAVVYLHGCGGLGKAARARFSALLTGWGYVSLAVDSFATRGIKEACDLAMSERQADAWGALQYLSKLTFVDRERIAVLGSSQGGVVALQLASTHDVKLFDIPDGLSFKAAIAFYPLCGIASEQLAMPTIVMIGELDDWAPAKNCEQWLARRKEGGAPVKLVVYPGAYHDFDVPRGRRRNALLRTLAEIRL